MAFIQTICESLGLRPVQVDTVYGQTTAITCESTSDGSKVRLLIFTLQSEAEKGEMRGILEILQGMEGQEGLLRVREVRESADRLAAVVDWTDINLAADIESRRQQNCPYEEKFITSIAYIVLKALSTLRKTSIKHAVVSPANIFVTAEGDLQLFPVDLHPENLSIWMKSDIREELLGLGLTLWCMAELNTCRREVKLEDMEKLEGRISPSLFALIRGAISGLEESQLLAQLIAASSL